MEKTTCHPTKLFAGIFLVLLSFIAGCKKQAQEPKLELKENISRTELMNWIKVYESIIPNGPKASLDKAVKTYYKDQMIVKVPLSSGGGDLYFTKKTSLEVQFIRTVSDDNVVKNPFNGYYEFINLNNYKYLKINFSQGKEISRIGSNSISSKDYSNQIRSTNYYVGSWFGALLYCIGEYIIAIPRREGNGWKCYGPGNDNPEEVQTFLPTDAGGSNFNWPAWYLFYQPSYANYLNNPQNGDPWLPYSGGYYDPNNPTAFTPPPASVDPNNPNAPQSPISWFESIYDRSEYDFETGDNENDFVVGNEDNHIYSEYQGNEGWPTIQNVIPKTDFVGWNNRLHPDWQCMQYAIAQIAKKNKYISQYFASNQTIQIYKTSTGANANAAKVAVRYLMTSLQNGDPVIVGVDDEDGSPNMLTDQTTDHFIVIVGMGTNAKGTYFTFYDNASGDPTQGASDDNKLYYKEAEGKITGKSKTAYANRNNRREYVVTQIRKNKHEKLPSTLHGMSFIRYKVKCTN